MAISVPDRQVRIPSFVGPDLIRLEIALGEELISECMASGIEAHERYMPTILEKELTPMAHLRFPENGGNQGTVTIQGLLEALSSSGYLLLRKPAIWKQAGGHVLLATFSRISSSGREVPLCLRTLVDELIFERAVVLDMLSSEPTSPRIHALRIWGPVVPSGRLAPEISRASIGLNQNGHWELVGHT